MGKFALTVFMVGLFSTSSISSVYAKNIIELDRPDVLIRDVVDVDPDHEIYLEAVLDLSLFKLNSGQQVELSSEALAEMIVKRAPVLKGKLNPLSTSSQYFIWNSLAVKVPSSCVTLAVPMKSGEVISRSHTVYREKCSGEPSSDIRYARQLNSWIANTELDPGTQLPIRSRQVLPLAGAGEDFTLTSRVGPVAITRPVKLMKPVFEAGWTHVKTSEGTVVRTYFLGEELSKP